MERLLQLLDEFEDLVTLLAFRYPGPVKALFLVALVSCVCGLIVLRPDWARGVMVCCVAAAAIATLCAGSRPASGHSE